MTQPSVFVNSKDIKSFPSHRAAPISVFLALSQTSVYTVRPRLRGQCIALCAWYSRRHLPAKGWPGWVDLGPVFNNNVNRRESYLWEYGDARAQLVQAECCYGNAINENLSGRTLNDTKQRKRQWTLAGARSSNYPNLQNNTEQKKNSCLHYLVPRPSRGKEAEKLRRPLPFVPQTARTTRFQQSYMIYALNNYQI